jgi:hypothetical protein
MQSLVRLILLLAGSGLLPAQGVPAPAAVLGSEPGTDGVLFEWREILDYFELVAGASERVRLVDVGRTTEGERLVLAVVSSPRNLARLEELRAANRALAEPRGRTEASDLELAREGRVFVLVHASIHSSEVGPAQASLRLLHFLATTEDPDWTGVLDHVVVLLNPCHNPDGYVRWIDWWKRMRADPGTAGAPMPWLYHRYVGHDNNRDWILLTQRESVLTVRGIQLHWRPQVTVDQHQMGGTGARIFVPPYQEPMEPNVPEALQDSIAWLGEAVVDRLVLEGHRGVWCRRQFDAWSPSRAFMHYHGGVRFLTEVASANGADPALNVPPPRGEAGRTSPHNPAPWRGGRWTLRDAVELTEAAARAVIRHAGENRKEWLLRFARVHRESVAVEAPAAFAIPAGGPRMLAAAALLRALALGGLEIHRTTHATGTGDGALPKGSFVIPRGQPFFPWAKALLETTPYPLVQNERGQRLRPYDVTAHCLPLLFDLEVRALDLVPEALEAWTPADPDAGVLDLLGPRPGLAAGEVRLDPADEGSHLRVLEALHQGRIVQRELPAAPGTQGAFRILREGSLPGSAPRLRPARIMLYESWLARMNEGWTRFFLDHLGIPFHHIRNHHLRDPSFRFPGNVLVITDLDADELILGRTDERVPPPWRGGIGTEGAGAARRFVEDGGVLVAIGSSAPWAAEYFGLPLERIATGRGVAPPEESAPDGEPAPRVSLPGCLLRSFPASEDPLTLGLGRELPILWNGSRAFRVRAGAPAPSVALQVASEDILVAGYGEGESLLAGAALVLSARVGQGQVVLFGFDPLFRSWTWGSFRLFLNACLLAEE